MSRVHELKCWPEPFGALLHGLKRHEIRVNDRGYQVGDVLHLREWKPSPRNAQCTACGVTMSDYAEYEEYQHDGCGGLVVVDESRGYTGRLLNGYVTYMTDGGKWGLPAGLCVMSIAVHEPDGQP